MLSLQDAPDDATANENLLPVQLALCDHYGAGATFVLRKLPVIFGRDERADVRLADPWVSHRHCELAQRGNVLVVKDLGSKNGIFLCGHRVRESRILSGDRLTVGRTEIVFRYGRGAHTAVEVEVSELPKQKPAQLKPTETLELLY